MFRHEAIYKTHSNVVRYDDGLGAFDRAGDTVTLDEDAIAAKVVELQAAFDSQQYYRDRKDAYLTEVGSVTDQLDMQYHDAVDGTSVWVDAIAELKAKHPKP